MSPSLQEAIYTLLTRNETNDLGCPSMVSTHYTPYCSVRFSESFM